MTRVKQDQPRQTRTLETERKLKTATLALLDEGGLEACTAPAVARRAEVAVGTIYVRYADKDALIAAALLDMATLQGGAADGVYAAMAADAKDLEAFLRTIAATAVKITREHRVFLLAVREFVRKTPNEAWRKQFRGAQGRGREQILKAALQRFDKQVRGGEAALRMSLAAIYGAVEVTWLDPTGGLFNKTPAPAAFVDALVEMQLAYLT